MILIGKLSGYKRAQRCLSQGHPLGSHKHLPIALDAFRLE